MKIFPKSLYKRLLLTGSLSAVIAISLLGGYLAYNLGQQATNSALAEAELLTKTTASSLSSALIVKDYDAIEQSLIQLARQSKIQQIKVINLQGRVIIATHKDTKGIIEINYGGQEHPPSLDISKA